MQNPLSLRAFLSWVEKQPANKEYHAGMGHECAYCQFLKANGFPNARVDNEFWQPDYKGVIEREEPLDPRINTVVYGHNSDTPDWTFGALASRLREQVQ